MLVSEDRVVFIDPRGYFGTTRLFGDPAYDWAKLLYSLLTNYDQFNLGRFRLSIMSGEVDLVVESSGWEKLAPEVFEASGVSRALPHDDLGYHLVVAHDLRLGRL